MYVITDECIACGSCEAECPVEAISEADSGDIYVIDQDICTECGTCVDVCPTEAIIEK
jgi:NAD-dependent dihydropyrimidine dehydrogenase PreA subunit